MFGSGKSPEEKAQAKRWRDLSAACSALGLTTMRVGRDPLRFIVPNQGDVPVAGCKISIDRGEAAKRITATRVALTGIFALALKKDATQLFITLEGADGSAALVAIPAKRELAARKLQMMVQGVGKE